MAYLATALLLVELNQWSLLGTFIAVSSSRMNSVVQMHFKHSDPTQCLRTFHLCKQLLYVTIKLMFIKLFIVQYNWEHYV